MKKSLALLFLFFLTSSTFAQFALKADYQKAHALFNENKTEDAYTLFKELLPQLKETDSLYSAVSYYRIASTAEMESQYRLKQDFTNSLAYGLEALKLLKEIKIDKAEEKKVWMTKNIIVSYSGLGEINKAKEYKTILYEKYKNKTLPQGIDEYFNFDFFKLDNKNVWGYEWFEEMPEDRFSSSFTKIVYYVYSTNDDGTDKDQLCRYHLLMFHQNAKNAKFDYLLEKQVQDGDNTISGSYYKYVYDKDIDYKKLKADIKTIISGQIEPNSRRTIKTK